MEQFQYIILPLIIGYILDLIFGDPRNIPHPIIYMGNGISFFDKHFNKNKNRLLKGALTTIFLTSLVFILFYLAAFYLKETNYYFHLVFTSIFVFYGLANKSLLQEGIEVFSVLDKEGLVAGRKRLSWIVGRDTKDLSEQEVRLAVLETLSENLSDGVVAPLFFYAIGGVPAMMAYKMINTQDSMIAYKSEKYFLFGKIAAYMDDIANFIPARITGVLMAIVSFKPKAFIFMYKFGRSHASPNSGYPESALAGILNCQFGGAHDYNGVSVSKPYIGTNNRTIINEDINKIKYINHTVCLFSILIISIFVFFI